MSLMTNTDWHHLAGDPVQREHALCEHAVLVFRDVERAQRWLRRSSFAIAGNPAPLTACRSTHGFFEAMAELARIDSFERREALKRCTHHRARSAEAIAR